MQDRHDEDTIITAWVEQSWNVSMRHPHALLAVSSDEARSVGVLVLELGYRVTNVQIGG